MTVEQFANNALTTLSSPILSGSLSLSVASGSQFPAIPQFRILVGNELMLVTGVAGNVFTVSRGQEGTLATDHPIGTPVAHIMTAGAINQLKADAFTPGTDLSGTASSQMVVGLRGRAIKDAVPTDGQVLTWVALDNMWEPSDAASGFIAGGDLSGTPTSQTVIRIQGHDVSSSAPSAGQALLWDAITGWTPGNVATSVTFSDVQAALATASSPVGFNNQKITGLLDPTDPQDAATRSYVLSVAQGLNPKESVVAVATTAVTLSGLAQVADTIPLNSDGMRVLLIAQSGVMGGSHVDNGIWVVHSGAWTRPADFAVGSHVAAAYMFTQQGSTYSHVGWVCANDTGSDVVGTDALSFVEFTAGPAGAAGGDLSGSYPSPTVAAIRGNSVMAGAPSANGQYYRWSVPNNRFELGKYWDPVQFVAGNQETSSTTWITVGAAVVDPSTAPSTSFILGVMLETTNATYTCHCRLYNLTDAGVVDTEFTPESSTVPNYSSKVLVAGTSTNFPNSSKTYLLQIKMDAGAAPDKVACKNAVLKSA